MRPRFKLLKLGVLQLALRCQQIHFQSPTDSDSGDRRRSTSYSRTYISAPPRLPVLWHPEVFATLQGEKLTHFDRNARKTNSSFVQILQLSRLAFLESKDENSIR